MRFEEISGHQKLKASLIQSVQNGRVSHAQLFHGPEGNGGILMAIAYAQYLSCDNPSETDSCGQCPSCKQFTSFNYPDLHFIYPVAKTQSSTDKPTSIQFLQDWKSMIDDEPFFGLFRWLERLGIENKQAQISVHESSEILKQMSLKSYSGGYKFIILWLPEKMNNSASNKLLKAIEEPPEKTLFLLVSENVEYIIQTITSRCQKVLIPKYDSNTVEQYLVNSQNVEASEARVIAKLVDGNMANAITRSNRAAAYKSYALHFSSWVRACFKADTHQILAWVDDIAKLEREKLKDFLLFCSSTVKDSFNLNYLQGEVSNTTFEEIKFELEKFAPFVHLKNVPDILSLLDNAQYDVSRNGNPKVILTDISLNLARKLRVKP